MTPAAEATRLYMLAHELESAEAIKEIESAIRAAVEAERAACAKVAKRKGKRRKGR